MEGFMSKLKKAVENARLIKEAREWLTDKSHWVEGHIYKDGSTCAIGAVAKVAGLRLQNGTDTSLVMDDPAITDALDIVARAIPEDVLEAYGYGGRDRPRTLIYCLNDDGGYEVVQEMFQKGEELACKIVK